MLPRTCLRLLFAILMLPLAAAAAVPDMVEVRSEFLYATTAQMKAAIQAAGIDSMSGPFSAKQAAIVREKSREGGAEFFSDPCTMARNGMGSTVTSVREVRYPVKYVPSEKEPGKSIPTAFETRNAGVEMKFVPTISPNGSTIDLQVSPTVTTFLGFIDYAAAKPARAAGDSSLESLLKAPLSPGGIWTPVFSTFSLETTITLGNGQSVLLGGVMKVGKIPPRGDGSEPKSQAPEQQVFVLITAKTISP